MHMHALYVYALPEGRAGVHDDNEVVSRLLVKGNRR